MAKVLLSEEILQDTANSLRTKLNSEDKIKPSEFASKLDSLSVSAPVTKGISINGFDENGIITSIDIIGMTSIPAYYFSNVLTTKNLFKNASISLNLPNDLTVIEDYAFNGCSGLILTELPSSIIRLGAYSFANCTELALTSLPVGITKIPEDCFLGCTSLALTSLPEGVTLIERMAFQNCPNITLTKFPSSLTSIANQVFHSCTGLTTLEIHAGITRVDKHTFYSCTNLSEVKFLGDITSIGSYAFHQCALSKMIFYNATTVPTLDSTAFSSSGISKKTGYIYVPDSMVDTFKAATNWSVYADQIKPISELEVTE